MNTKIADSEILERTIDKVGVSQLLDTIGNICFEKEQHVAENWQDEGLAQQWHTAAMLIQELANKRQIKIIS